MGRFHPLPSDPRLLRHGPSSFLRASLCNNIQGVVCCYPMPVLSKLKWCCFSRLLRGRLYLMIGIVCLLNFWTLWHQGRIQTLQPHSMGPRLLHDTQNISVKDHQHPVSMEAPDISLFGRQAPGSKWKYITPEMVEQVYSSSELAKQFGLNGPQEFMGGTCPVDGWAFVPDVPRGMLIGPSYKRIRPKAEVWVLVMMPALLAELCPFTCQFYLDKQTPDAELPMVKASCLARRSSKGHSPYVVTCQLGSADNVQLVQLVYTSGDSRADLAKPTQVLHSQEKKQSGFAVCVGPTYKLFRAQQMQTFLEYYNHAGASHIFLYNHSWTRSVDAVINQFEAQHPGSVTSVPWKFSAGKTLPLGTDGGCWSHLASYDNFQFLQMNDCLGRAYSFDFAASIDLDEFLWNQHVQPPLPQGWLHSQLEQKRAQQQLLCSWQVRNTFVDTCDELMVRGEIWKSATIAASGTRSKEIWIPQHVEHPMVHTVSGCVPQTRCVTAAPEELLLMHMRYGWGRDKFVQQSKAFAELMRRFCHVDGGTGALPALEAAKMGKQDEAGKMGEDQGYQQEDRDYGQTRATEPSFRHQDPHHSRELEKGQAEDGVRGARVVVDAATSKLTRPRTAKIMWNVAGSRFGEYVIRYSTEAPAGAAVRIAGEFGRTGNRFIECEHLVYYGIMCSVPVECGLDPTGVQYIDARQVQDGLKYNNLPVLLPFLKPEFHCNLAEVSAQLLYFKIPRNDELAGWDHLLPVLRKAALVSVGALRPGWVQGNECSADDQRRDLLVGHVRSGDIFRSRTAHIYGQPPLAYWRECIDDSRFSRVRLFLEDLENPVAARLVQMAAGQLKGRLEVLVKQPMRKVMTALLCAKHVVMGQSTMTAIAGSSWHLESLVIPFTCNGDSLTKSLTVSLDSYQHARNLPMHKTWYVPTPGYSPRKIWEGSEAQLHEMLSYRAQGHIQPCHQEPPFVSVETVANSTQKKQKKE